MKAYLLGLILCAAFLHSATAQFKKESADMKRRKVGKNLVKVNLTGFMIRNYSFQAERLLSKRISLAFSYRIMPDGALPFRDQLSSFSASTGNGAKNSVEELITGNTAMTPEVRFYMGKNGYGKGFYIAPFYRICDYSVGNASIAFTNSSGTESSLAISGKVYAATYGLQLGAQWNLGKKLVMDWWIAGPQYGSAQGVLSGVPNVPLTQLEIDNLSAALDKVDIPFTQSRATVTATRASLVLDGPWAGIRTGLVFGVRF